METEFTWNRSLVIANPHAYYSQLRSRAPRLCEVDASGTENWTLTTHADVSLALKDPRFILEWRSLLTPEEQEATAEPINPVYQMFRQWMLFRDPPDHSRLRGLVSKAFTPRMVEQLRPRVGAIAQSFVDDLRARGSVDLVAGYAFLIPITVIAEMLGVPVDDRQQFRVWSRAIANALDSAEESSDPQLENAGRTAMELTHYFRGLVAARRREPRADLISAMIAAEEAGDKLTEHELLATLILLLVAGHETTVNLIGNSIILLKQHPELLRALVDDPNRIPTAVEEFLRYESPVMITSRYASQDIQLGEQIIHRGAVVTLALISANRDPAAFAQPDALDITRQPNRHVAFGGGIHFCLGAPLARLEAEMALRALVPVLDRVELAQAATEWRDSVVFRGPVELRARVG